MQKDPYKYFRIEAREIMEAMGQDILAMEKGERAESIKRLLRQAHTLKGAARVVKQGRIAEMAHEMETCLSGDTGDTGAVNSLFGLVDGMSQLLAALQAPNASPPVAQQAAPAPPAPVAHVGHVGLAVSRPVASPSASPIETARVNIGDMDILLAGVAEASVRLGVLHQLTEPIVHAKRLADALVNDLLGLGQRQERKSSVRIAEALQSQLTDLKHSYAAGIERLTADMRQLTAHAHSLRLVPAHTMFGVLERAARDAADALGKQIAFSCTGGATALDGHVLAPVRDALLHVVRNAVAHGTEAPSERLASGKAPRGQVTVHVEQHGSRIVFTCTDDGRGIDVEAVKQAAVQRGALAESAAITLGTADGMRLIFLPGVSTASQLTEVSGRGVGLDAVEAAITKLKGTIDVTSTPGRGTAVVLTVPLSLTSITALVCSIEGNETALLPLSAVEKLLRIEDRSIARTATYETIVYDSKSVPFLPLTQVLGKPAASPRAIWSVAVVRCGTAWVALGIPRLVGISDVVVRPIPPHAAAAPCIAGACFDAQGDPRPMLDPQGLAEAVTGRTGRSTAPVVKVRPPILIVDDSLTTRMLEQSILQSAGYEVELATSAETALDIARTRAFGLFIVDVEMPGMNGFEFVARTRADPQLRKTPAVLVTSLSTPEDRRRGMESGRTPTSSRASFIKNIFCAPCAIWWDEVWQIQYASSSRKIL